MNRKALALVALAVLVVGAGCLTGGGPSDEDLRENATYNWNTTTDVSIEVFGGSYQAVYNVTNTSEMEVYTRDTFGQKEPQSSLKGLQFRYPNGTQVNASAFNVSSNRQRTLLGFPAEDGKVAFTVSKRGKELRTPVFQKGSHQVTIPKGTSVGLPILAHVVPGGYNTTVVDGRVQLTWQNVTSDTLVVDYYLERDVLFFGGLFLIGFVIAVGGGLYYWRQIRSLENRRKDVGLDVEDEDDDDPRDRGPPPGMG